MYVPFGKFYWFHLIIYLEYFHPTSKLIQHTIIFYIWNFLCIIDSSCDTNSISIIYFEAYLSNYTYCNHPPYIGCAFKVYLIFMRSIYNNSWVVTSQNQWSVNIKWSFICIFAILLFVCLFYFNLNRNCEEQKTFCNYTKTDTWLKKMS